MEQREDLLEQREKLMEEFKILNDKLHAINELILVDPWMKENNVQYWQWNRATGFVITEPKKRKPRRSKVINSKLNELIGIVAKHEPQKVERKKEATPKTVEKSAALQFTYFPDTMEEKAYSHK